MGFQEESVVVNFKKVYVIMNKKKSLLIKVKRFIKYNKSPIRLFMFLLLFPVVIGLIYKIPVNFINIEIADLLSFYAVALGLFATYLTYRKSEEQNVLKRQETLKPKIELYFEINCDDRLSIVCIKNVTDNDYVIDYFNCDYYEDEKRRSLNANSQLKFTVEDCDENCPKTIVVGIIDTDQNNWLVGFEYQEGTSKYCRDFIDIL